VELIGEVGGCLEDIVRWVLGTSGDLTAPSLTSHERLRLRNFNLVKTFARYQISVYISCSLQHIVTICLLSSSSAISFFFVPDSIYLLRNVYPLSYRPSSINAIKTIISNTDVFSTTAVNTQTTLNLLSAPTMLPVRSVISLFRKFTCT
jgi:hypothetical protein